MKKDNEINFSLKKIQTEQFAAFEELFDEKNKVNLNTQIQFKLNYDDKMIGSFVAFTFEQKKKPFLKIEVSCHYELNEQSMNSFLDKKTSKITIPKDFLAHLAMITIGTARGVLFSKTEGSRLNTFIIPTLNISEMITNDGKFSTSD